MNTRAGCWQQAISNKERDHAAPEFPLSFDVAGRKGAEPTKKSNTQRPSHRPRHEEKDSPSLLEEMRTSPLAAPRIGLIVKPYKKKKKKREPERGGPVYFFDLAAPSTSLTLRAANARIRSRSVSNPLWPCAPRR